MTLNVPALSVVKWGACLAIGWFLGKGIYSLAVELVIAICGKLSRMF